MPRRIHICSSPHAATYIALALLLVVTSLGAAPDADAPAKLAVPPPADVSAAEKVIKETFESGLGTAPATRKALAKNLLDEAKKTSDTGPPAERFAMLRQARELAISGGDYLLADEAIQCTAEHYEIAAEALEGPLLTSALQSHVPGAPASAAPIALRLSAHAEGKDDFKAAEKWIAIAQQLADRSHDPATIALVRAKRADMRLRAADFDRARAGLETLKEHPDDGAARLAVGLYKCFDDEDWDAGLPMLAKSSDPKLAELAAEEIKIPSGPAAAKLADLWFDYSNDHTVAAAYRKVAARRASHWYHVAMPDLKGLEARAAEMRLAELEKANTAEFIYLSHLDPVTATGMVRDGTWGVGIDSLSPHEKRPITVNGVVYAHGIGFNVNDDNGTVSITFNLGQRYSELTGIAGVNDTAGQFTATLTYKIFGDGKELWSSQPINATTRSDRFGVIVQNVKVLELRLICSGRREDAHSVWVEPKLVLK